MKLADLNDADFEFLKSQLREEIGDELVDEIREEIRDRIEEEEIEDIRCEVLDGLDLKYIAQRLFADVMLEINEVMTQRLVS